jgi:hypothetical protein
MRSPDLHHGDAGRGTTLPVIGMGIALELGKLYAHHFGQLLTNARTVCAL